MKRRTKQHPLIKQVRSIVFSVKVHQIEDLNVSFVARELGVTINHLSRTFKEQCGFKIQKFILAYKMRHAVKLLDREKEVKEVSEIMGWSSVSYFHKTFEQFFSLSPTGYCILRGAPPEALKMVMKKSGIREILE